MTHQEVIERAASALSYRFNDTNLLFQTLTHASIAESRLKSNERLEFFGDAILGAVVCEELFRRFPDELEGELTKLKSAIVSRKTCARIADQNGLTPLLIIGKGMTSQEEIPPSVRAAVYEAIIAGIHIDGGFEAAREFVLKTVSPFIDEAANSDHQENFKSILQQVVQKQLSLTPRYDQLDEQGPDHSKCFEVCVSVGNRKFPAAWGASKKEAEQRAAKRALQEINPTACADDPPDQKSAEEQT